MYTEYTTIDNRHTHPVGVMNVIKDWIDQPICCEHFKQPYAETWNGGGHGVIIYMLRKNDDCSKVGVASHWLVAAGCNRRSYRACSDHCPLWS